MWLLEKECQALRLARKEIGPNDRAEVARVYSDQTGLTTMGWKAEVAVWSSHDEEPRVVVVDIDDKPTAEDKKAAIDRLLVYLKEANGPPLAASCRPAGPVDELIRAGRKACSWL